MTKSADQTARRVLGALVLAGTLCAPGVASAQSSTPASDEIIVTGPLEGAAIESLQGAAILRRDDIVETLNGGLGNALDALPGVSTTFFGAGASRPIIRGLGDDRVRLLENGIGTIDAASASPDHAVTADGLDAERIEVLRGAAALAYGGNAVGGVVNVLDSSIPAHAPSDGFSANALGAYATGDESTQGALDATGALGAFVVHGSLATRSTEDYAIPDSATDEAPNSWTDYDAYVGGLSYIGAWGHVGVAAKRTETDYGLPPESADEPGGHIELEQTRYEARGEVRFELGPFDRIDFAVQSADYEHTEFEGDGAPGTLFTNEGWEARLEAHHNGLAGKLNGAVGVQMSEVDFAAVGDESFIAPTTTEDRGVFAVERWDNGFWGLEGGLRYETRELDNAALGSLDFDSASASAGVFVRPLPNWFFGATLARTERAPTAVELFADGPHLATANYEIGAASLDKETATSIEGSARYTTDTLKFEVNVFRAEFADYIALVDRGDFFWFDEDSETSDFVDSDTDPSIPATAEVLPVFHFTQQDATFTGAELSATVRLFEAAGFAVSADGAIDYVRAEFDAGDAPPRIPPRTLTLGLAAENDHWRARLEAVDTAEQDRIAAYETPTEGFTFVNARLTWRPDGEAGAATIMLDARNLTDELGRVHASFLKDELPLPGRTVRLAVIGRF